MPRPLKPLGLLLAGGSGVLYGLINVAADFIDADPLVKAAGAYLVSGILMSPFLRGLRVEGRDWPRVLAMGLIGGGVAPVLLFYGLREAAAVDAGLLLTMEFVATAVLAYLFLGERASGRASAGLALLFFASLLVALSGGGGETETTMRGVLLVLGSAVAWGVDNAASAHLVGSYRPPQLIAVKGLLGGLAAAAGVLLTGADLPGTLALGQLALMGFVSIACSSMLFYYALGLVGAARTSAMNIATTAVVGAAGGALFLDESLGWLHGMAIALVMWGSLLLAERPKTQVAASPVAA